MIAHSIPRTLATLKSGLGHAAGDEGARGVSPWGWQSGLPLDEERDGPVCVPLHAASRCQGSRLGAGAVSRRAGARWLRWPLLLSGPGPAGARCRRQRAADGDRSADCGLAALFGPARAVFAGVLRTSETLKIDREGRVQLTESLKAHAAIADTVSFVGLGYKFQIWEPGRFRSEFADD